MTKPMKHRDLVKKLRAAGFVRLRQGKGGHEVRGIEGLDRPVVITTTREVSPAVTRNALKAIDEATGRDTGDT
ncbi:toxin HicA [Corynebacterium sp. CNJ-954]|uniref:toxin HicA n=1 Tax=Corynebacterium sp. CNJ-954 TaxID=1904962 RepID=UPI0009647F27|nr:toxin HicA [Corynebacterium sp. CNJ-954]OLT54429.1 toxin HicA [Corynebacterium sp. CNJ-954]